MRMAGYADDVLALLDELVRIGAPTFKERRRSDFMLAWLQRELKSGAVGQDAAGNLWVDLSGGEGMVHLVDAHIDTVFPQLDLEIQKEDGRWHVPGVFDNTVSCALLMMWLKTVAVAGVRLPVVAVFTVGEEGEGNLVGARAMAHQFKDRALGVVALDLGIGSSARRAIGSIRHELTFTTTGGHSWNHFGTPNAIHEAARWILALESAFPWSCGVRSFNVGTIEGGTGINVIASSARFKLDVRSLDLAFLAEFRQWLELEVAARCDGSEVVMTSRLIGFREAGEVAADHPLVALLEKTHETLGLPLAWDDYSTNANAYLGAGIPAVVTGIADGDGIHTEKEYLELDSVEVGARKLTRLMELWLTHSA